MCSLLLAESHCKHSPIAQTGSRVNKVHKIAMNSVFFNKRAHLPAENTKLMRFLLEEYEPHKSACPSVHPLPNQQETLCVLQLCLYSALKKASHLLNPITFCHFTTTDFSKKKLGEGIWVPNFKVERNFKMSSLRERSWFDGQIDEAKYKMILEK